MEQAAGESLDAAVARAEFDEVWAVLQALQEQDEVLDDLIHQMQAERRLAKGFHDFRFRERYFGYLNETGKNVAFNRTSACLGCVDLIVCPPCA